MKRKSESKSKGVSSHERNAVIDECIQECKHQIEVFLSPLYAKNQPMASFSERFAVGTCIDALERLKTQ